MTRLMLAIPLAAFCAAAAAQSGETPSGEMPPYTLDPGPHPGDWEATLTGTGLSDDSFDSPNFGVTGSLGRYLTKNIIFTVKQGLQLDDTGNSTLIDGRTIFQAAYQWDRVLRT